MGKKPPDDVPGDTVASARAVTEYWYNIGIAIGKLDKYREFDHHDAPTLIEVRVKCDPADALGVLVVVKGLSDDGPVVAFHRGETIVEAVVGACNRVANHTLKWREDQYG